VTEKPLIAHVLYRLDTGGMEQVAISVINGTDKRYRHAVICLAGVGAVRKRIENADVPCLSLDKRPGKDWACYFRLWKTLRRLRPDMVQTYNIGTLDVAPVAWLAGVRRVVHAEHGRDAADPDGTNRRYRAMRRWLQPFVARYVAVSRDLQNWLVDAVGIRESRVTYIANGIDVARFDAARVRPEPRRLLGDFAPEGAMVLANVARLDEVKDQACLITAFKLLREMASVGHVDMRLVIAGDGPQRAELQQQIEQLGLAESVRLLGNREDVPELLAACDVFALSSIAEGMPVTLLEAMAANLPVVSTKVGGIASVVESGVTGTLVPARDPRALANAMAAYVADRDLRRQHGSAGHARATTRFSLRAMIAAYTALYDGLLNPRRAVVQLHEGPTLGRREDP
jgi:sugar transferase (PEP-CTERM/EpsH1 system associated)